MPVDSPRKYSPPYISPRTFHNLLEKLKNNIPDRIDRSYLDSMFSGSASTQIVAALRFLSLIDGINKPTARLRTLANAGTDERPRYLRDVIGGAYPQLLNGEHVNLASATYNQLEEAFQGCYSVDGDVRRKCIKFFTTMAVDAGVPLSTHITDRVRSIPVGPLVRPVGKKSSSKSSRTAEVPQAPAGIPQHALLDKLINKFPDHDHKWNAEERKAWLDAYQVFLRLFFPDTKQ